MSGLKFSVRALAAVSLACGLVAAQAEPLDQWADHASASSVMFDGYDMLAIGAPDEQEYGWGATSWQAAQVDGSLEWLNLTYLVPVYAYGAVVVETWGNGFVYQIDAVDMNDHLHTVWGNVLGQTDTTAPGAIAALSAQWTLTDYLVKGLKIYVNTDLTKDELEQVDAVQLLGQTPDANDPGTGNGSGTGTGNGTGNMVPEPSGIALALVALAAGGWTRRRRA